MATAKKKAPVKRNPKAKGSATKKAAAKKKPTDVKRLLNMGKEVETTFGKFTVKELDIYTLTSVLSESLEAYMLLSKGDKPLEVLKRISKEEELKLQVSNILATFCGAEDPTPFLTIKLRDFVKVIKTIFEVVDFEEIKEVFLEAGLQKYLPQATSTAQ